MIHHSSDPYWQGVELRRQVLRLPLGLDFSEADLEAERSQIHIVAKGQDAVIGTLLLAETDAQTLKMRQVAVALDHQGHGVGKRLIESAEKFARDHGYSEITLHARLSVFKFYERLGYHAVGPEFSEVSIPHKAMQKSLKCLVTDRHEKNGPI